MSTTTPTTAHGAPPTALLVEYGPIGYSKSGISTVFLQTSL
ncbi:hypothetical protein WKH59_18515 [Acinetobacter baumannii]